MTKIITEPKELYGFLATPGIEVMKPVFAIYKVVWVSWKYRKEEHVPILRHTNEVIGAYVTAGSRIHLDRYLDRLKWNAFYCDSDSVMYIQTSDETGLIETGDKLGEMLTQLRLSDTISQFVSGAPRTWRKGCSILRPISRKPSLKFGT